MGGGETLSFHLGLQSLAAVLGSPVLGTEAPPSLLQGSRPPLLCLLPTISFEYWGTPPTSRCPGAP